MLCAFCKADNPDTATLCRVCGVTFGRPGVDDEELLPIGSSLQQGAYVINRALGQGGFGITYLGSDIHLNRAVAIKEFCPAGCHRKCNGIQPFGTTTQAQFEEARLRFLEEARTLARFRHPGIVNVFAAFEENNTAYMVMEHLSGKTLAEVVRERGGPLPEAEAIGFIREAGAALSAVHAAGLLHRDIKPENMMHCQDGRIVLIDFGTARDFAVGRTQGHTVVVTPGYAPLEQYAQNAQRGAFSDVYGLAATLYFLLTAKPPAPATDRAAGVEFEAPHQLVEGISPHVSEAVAWAMQLKVDQRPQSVQDFIDAIDQIPGAFQGRSLQTATKADPEKAKVVIRSTGSQLLYVQSARAKPGPIQLEWPKQCCCCGATPSETVPVAFVMEGELAPAMQVWHAPYCSWCLKHVEESEARPRRLLAGYLNSGCLAGFIGISLLVALFTCAYLNKWLPLWLWLGPVLLAIYFFSKWGIDPKESMKPTCWTTGPAVTCTNIWHGDEEQIVYTLEFKSPVYREVFERLNSVHGQLPE